MGGIGSRKTTELLLTTRTLNHHDDAVNIFLDLADYTDLNELNTEAILATAGMRLYDLLKGLLRRIHGLVQARVASQVSDREPVRERGRYGIRKIFS